MKFMPSKRPFVGLRSFESSEIDIFFGREKLIGEMLDRLSEHRFLAVTGISGGGKSSLVKTGLIDGLKSNLIIEAGSIWTIIEIRPHNRPIYSLAESLLNKLPTDRRFHNDVEFLVSRLKRNPKDFVVFLEENRKFFQGSLLIIIDQFEEIFRYEENDSHKISDAEFNNVMILVDLLIHSSNQTELATYNVITIRSDYLGKCALFNGLPELINKSQFIIPRLTRDELNDAIEYPVKMHGGEIEPALTNRILNDLGHNLDQLPQMQHALMRMWDIVKEVNPKKEKLTLGLYEKNGGLEDSISQHADEIYNTLDNHEKEVCRKIFIFITRMNSRGEYVRRPQQVKDICIGINEELEVIESITKKFRKEDVSFLRPNAKISLSNDMILDITHESIMRQWKRLKEWIKEEAKSASGYKGLQTRANRYKNNEGALLIEPDLTRLSEWEKEQKPTVEWSKRYGNDFKFVMDFLENSKKDKIKKDKENRKKKRNQKILGTISIMLLISLLSYLINDEFMIAKQNEKIAIANEKEAKHNEEIAKQKLIVLNNKKEAEVEKQKLIAINKTKEAELAKFRLKEEKNKVLLTQKEKVKLEQEKRIIEIKSTIDNYLSLLQEKNKYEDKLKSIPNGLAPNKELRSKEVKGKLKELAIEILRIKKYFSKEKRYLLKSKNTIENQKMLSQINNFLVKNIEYRSYTDAINIARKKKKIVMVLVYYINCKNCREVDEYIDKNNNIKTNLNKYFEVVKINKFNEPIPSELIEQIRIFPTLLFLNPTSSKPKMIMQISEIDGEKELSSIIKEAVSDGHKEGYLKR